MAACCHAERRSIGHFRPTDRVLVPHGSVGRGTGREARRMVDRGARPRPSGCRCRGRSAQDDRPHEVDPPMDVKGLRVDSSGNLMRQGRGHPIRRHALEREVDLARDVVFEATDNLALGPVFRGPSGHVVLGPLVTRRTDRVGRELERLRSAWSQVSRSHRFINLLSSPLRVAGYASS